MSQNSTLAPDDQGILRRGSTAALCDPTQNIRHACALYVSVVATTCIFKCRKTEQLFQVIFSIICSFSLKDFLFGTRTSIRAGV